VDCGALQAAAVRVRSRKAKAKVEYSSAVRLKQTALFLDSRLIGPLKVF
jgi:hypothetical protein